MKGLRSTVITNNLPLLWPTNMIWEFCGIVLRLLIPSLTHTHAYINAWPPWKMRALAGQGCHSRKYQSNSCCSGSAQAPDEWQKPLKVCEHVSVMRMCVSQRSFQKNPVHCVLRKVERVNGNIHYR